MDINSVRHVICMSPLYSFLRLCENTKLEREILDCGAGGKEPPLYIFHMYGYRTHGIDVSEEQVRKAQVFCKEKGVDLGIEKGDMRSLPFEDQSISFVYSYNTIFHMPKKEIAIAMEEMKRVLKKDGLLFVNFISVDNGEFGRGQKVGPGEFVQEEHGGKTLHSYHEDNEPDQYFNGFEVLYKQKRIIEYAVHGKRGTTAYIDYVAKKK